MPVYDEMNELSGYNIFRIEMLIRHASDGKLYLYDMVNTKKEASTLLKQQLYGNKLASFEAIIFDRRKK